MSFTRRLSKGRDAGRFFVREAKTVPGNVVKIDEKQGVYKHFNLLYTFDSIPDFAHGASSGTRTITIKGADPMKRLASLFLALALLAALAMPGLAADTVVLSDWSLMVDGRVLNCEKYNINGSNYFKLRDLAYALNGSRSQFAVEFDRDLDAVRIHTGEHYTPTGGELAFAGEDKSATAVPSSQSVLIDGTLAEGISVYNIGGNNYFKLRDLSGHLGFGVDYSAVSSLAIVNTMPQEQRELSAEEIYARCTAAVFFIEVYDAQGSAIKTGSGFFVDRDGVAVTNYHVISGADSAAVQLIDGRVFPVSGVYAWNADEDWAVLQIEGEDFDALTVGAKNTALGGSTIYTIGSPLGLQNTLSVGIISNPNRLEDGVSYIQISAPISQGSSGGALLNKYGEVIGITSAGYEDGQNLNLALPMSYVNYHDRASLSSIARAGNLAAGTVVLLESFVTIGLEEESYSVTVYSACEPGCKVRYKVEDESIVTAEWSKWDGDYIDLLLSPHGLGTTVVTVLLIDQNEAVLSSKNLTVTVAESGVRNGGELSLDEYNVTMGLEDSYFLIAYAQATDPEVKSYRLTYYLDAPEVLGCGWSEWYDGNYIDLNLYPKSTGTVSITVVLHDSADENRILDTKTAFVTVIPGSIYR